MKILLKQFGETLSSRQAGKDAYGGFASTLAALNPDETVEIDFEGVSSLAPSWGDEFLSPLLKQLGDRLILLKSKNLSVNATVELLEDATNQKFRKA